MHPSPQRRTMTLADVGGRGTSPTSTYVFLQVFCFFPFAFLTLSMLFIASFSFRVSQGTITVEVSGRRQGNSTVEGERIQHLMNATTSSLSEDRQAGSAFWCPWFKNMPSCNSSSNVDEQENLVSPFTEELHSSGNVQEIISKTYTFVDLPAQFGPRLRAEGISGQLVAVTPLDGCSRIRPLAPTINSKEMSIALIQRSPPGGVDHNSTIPNTEKACQFNDKVSHAEIAGYDAVIIFDSVYGPLVAMGTSSSVDVRIPSAFISLDDGGLILELLLKVNAEEGDERVNVTMKNTSINEQLWGNMLASMFLAGLCLSIVLASIVVIKRRQSLNQFYIRLALDTIHEQNQEQSSTRTPRTLREDQLESLKIRKYTCCDVDRRKNSELKYGPTGSPSMLGTVGGTWETCTICLEDYEDGDTLRELPCGHAFHKECVDLWLTTKSTACPVCKADCAEDKGLPVNTEDTPLLSSNAPIQTSTHDIENNLDD